MKKLLLVSSLFTSTFCATVGLSYLDQQNESLYINITNDIGSKKQIDQYAFAKEIVLENIVKDYIAPNILRIYSSFEFELTTFEDLTKAIENKMANLTGMFFKIKILHNNAESLKTGIDEVKANICLHYVETKQLVKIKLYNRAFKLLVNLEQSSDLQELVAVGKILQPIKYNFSLSNIQDKIGTSDFILFKDLYTKEFKNYDEVVLYLNNELKKSIWTTGVKATLNKRFIAINFISNFDNNRNNTQLLNYVNLNLKLNNYTITVNLMNLRSLNKLTSYDNISTLSGLNYFLSRLCHPDLPSNFWKRSSTYSYQDFATVLNEKVTYFFKNEMQIREEFQAEVILLQKKENSNFTVGENLLKLLIKKNYQFRDYLNYDLIVNWNKKPDKYDDVHLVTLIKYVLGLEQKPRKFENTKLIENNRHLDLKQLIEEDFMEYAPVWTSPYYFHFSNYNIEFLNEFATFSKGNNKVTVNFSFVTYDFLITYSISI